MKKRVLLVTDFSALPTGYGVYARELLYRLQAFGYEVAELACYVSQSDPRVFQQPWPVYANKPEEGSAEWHPYHSSPSMELGEFTFNSVCLHFMPHYVLDFRDPWAFEYQAYSPFRKFYNWIISPTTDAFPLNPEWVEMFGDADAVLSYSEFGRDTILEQGDVNFLDVASPGTSNYFHQFDAQRRISNRNKYGIPENIHIAGTVMRNQPRKLFPDLFDAFSKHIHESGRNDTFLYCHTAFPDLGWNIPELLIKYGLSNRVLFTYKCRKCEHVSVKFFNDTLAFCDKCRNFSCNIAGVGNGLSTKELSDIYNLFDFYIQASSFEGFGIPVVEAVMCGLNVACTNYSSMESFIKNINVTPIEILKLEKEASTGRNYAILDVSSLTKIMNRFFSLSRHDLYSTGKELMNSAKLYYNWDKCASVWIKAIESLDVKEDYKSWLSQPIALDPHPFIENSLSPIEQANFLISEVLREPKLMYKSIWRRLVKDLTYRSTIPKTNGLYFKEDYLKDSLKHKPFSFKDAYDQIYNLREYYNIWEDNRANVLGRLS